MKIEEAIKQAKFPDNYEKAVINVIYTANWLRDAQNSFLKKFGLLIQHYNALRIIKGRHPNPVSPGEIKEVMLDKANDITRLLDKLVEKELIKRDVCENNRRRVDVVITSKGMKFLQQMDKPIDELKEELRSRMSDKEAAMLSNLLDKIRG